MNEAEIENKPVEDEALLDFNDIKEAEEEEVVLFEEDTEEVSNDTEVSQNSEETESIPAEEVKEEEVDFKPLLDKLSKNIKLS